MGAQYSLPYCAALAVTADPRDPANYFGKELDEPSRRELARRLEIVVDPEMEAAYPKHYGARVRLDLVNGECHETAVLDPHGMPSDPCTDQERLDKFVRLASHVKSSAVVSDVIGMVRRAERLGSVRELTELLRT
jgi:2-methylcitrate dehydratase PrpD